MSESYQQKLWRGHLSRNGTSPTPTSSLTRDRSPAPRRSIQLPASSSLRPTFAPRTSSLAHFAAQNHSTSSLGSDLPNGSVGKAAGIKESTDPLKTLEGILGRAVSTAKVERIDGVERPPVLETEIDFRGVSLAEFAREHDGNQETTLQVAGEYEKKKETFEDLHESILECDEVLKSVETSLTNFQRDLGIVSAEIESLQTRSTNLNQRLENRKTVEQLLGPAVEDISIPPPVIRTIAQGPIDETWVQALEALEKKSKNIDAKLKGADGLRAANDIQPLLEKLDQYAVERIRDYFVSQIKALRSPNINAQIIQRNSLIQYRDLYTFLAKHHGQLAGEIAQAYINTMRWYYLSNFTRYQEALEKVPRIVVDKSDALGTDSSQKAKPLSSSEDALSLGRRADILGPQSSNALTTYLAEESRRPQPIESVFHSFNLALIDNASAEYSFLTSFFSALPLPTLSRHFSSIFSPTFTLGQAFTKSLVEPTHDCLGVLLCVRILQQLAFSLQRRKVPVVEGYINGTNMLLWPRFQLAMDMHIEAIKRATASLSPSRALSLSSSSSASQSTAPHHLTQRFGQFLQGILALSSSDSGAETDTEPVGASLGRLRDEVEKFLNKVAKGMPQAKKDRFLANNWSLLGAIVEETEGHLATETKEWVEALKEGVSV